MSNAPTSGSAPPPPRTPSSLYGCQPLYGGSAGRRSDIRACASDLRSLVGRLCSPAPRAEWPCLRPRSSRRSPRPTPPSPVPPRYTAVRRRRGDTRLPLGTSYAPPPHELLAPGQAIVGFFQAEALRLQWAVFL